jgi:signal transduction histidine kinase
VCEAVDGRAPGEGTGADVDAYLARRESWEGELEHRRRDDSVIVVESRQALLRDKRGAPLAILEINRDVTARKQQEQERERLLERERQARETAERAVRVRDEFLATAAHELKTPLTGVRGFTQTLLKLAENGTLDRARTEQALRHIEAGTTRLTQLVGHLFDVTRIEMGSLALVRVPTNLTQLCAEAAAEARAYTQAHVLSVQAPGPIWAEVDELRLGLVLSNLLDNAVKFSPGGGPIAVTLSVPDGGSVCIAIRDRGIGVPVQYRERLFNRLTPAHAESYRSGLGLGLYISRQIVEGHGGSLTAEFPEDGGSLFTVRLPNAGGGAVDV